MPSLAKKVCVVVGGNIENTSVSHGIAKQLGQAGAKVYVTEKKQVQCKKHVSDIKPSMSKNIVPIQGLLLFQLLG